MHFTSNVNRNKHVTNLTIYLTAVQVLTTVSKFAVQSSAVWTAIRSVIDSCTRKKCAIVWTLHIITIVVKVENKESTVWRSRQPEPNAFQFPQLQLYRCRHTLLAGWRDSNFSSFLHNSVRKSKVDGEKLLEVLESWDNKEIARGGGREKREKWWDVARLLDGYCEYMRCLWLWLSELLIRIHCYENTAEYSNKNKSNKFNSAVVQVVGGKKWKFKLTRWSKSRRLQRTNERETRNIVTVKWPRRTRRAWSIARKHTPTTRWNKSLVCLIFLVLFNRFEAFIAHYKRFKIVQKLNMKNEKASKWDDHRRVSWTWLDLDSSSVIAWPVQRTPNSCGCQITKIFVWAFLIFHRLNSTSSSGHSTTLCRKNEEKKQSKRCGGNSIFDLVPSFLLCCDCW